MFDIMLLRHRVLKAAVLLKKRLKLGTVPL
jgi:hypothetical protein